MSPMSFSPSPVTKRSLKLLHGIEAKHFCLYTTESSKRCNVMQRTQQRVPRYTDKTIENGAFDY